MRGRDCTAFELSAPVLFIVRASGRDRLDEKQYSQRGACLEETIQELADLLSETQKAHHQAYFEADGFDPEWPIWYADYLMPRLRPLLGPDMSRSKLIYLLVHLSKIQPAEAPDTDWADYYARYVLQQDL